MNHLVLSANGGPNDELVDVVELVPVLIAGVHVAVQRLELGATRDAHVERLGGDEAVVVEEVEVVAIRQIAQQLTCQPVQVAHLQVCMNERRSAEMVEHI
jgi:hypothetical protein